MIKIKIDGITYDNVSKPTANVIYDYSHDVVTLDGVRHREIRGKRTNYNILFFNNDLQKYDELKQKLNSAITVFLEVPNGAYSLQSGEYLVTVKGDELKGILYDGNYYNTALSVDFEKRGYDE